MTCWCDTGQRWTEVLLLAQSCQLLCNHSNSVCVYLPLLLPCSGVMPSAATYGSSLNLWKSLRVRQTHTQTDQGSVLLVTPLWLPVSWNKDDDKQLRSSHVLCFEYEDLSGNFNVWAHWFIAEQQFSLLALFLHVLNPFWKTWNWHGAWTKCKNVRGWTSQKLNVINVFTALFISIRLFNIITIKVEQQ